MRALVVVLALSLVLVCSAHASRPEPRKVVQITKKVFGRRWRVAACIAWAESRDELTATNGRNVGAWQINLDAHPWVSQRRIYRSWLYSARVAYRISDHGRDWSAWTTAGLC